MSYNDSLVVVRTAVATQKTATNESYLLVVVVKREGQGWGK